MEVATLRISDLILSFPHLEDLTVAAYKPVTDNSDGPDGGPTAVYPSTPPMTGFLVLSQREGMKSFAPLLLSIPGGIRFQKLVLALFREEDLLLAAALVAQCSQSLKSLHITYELPGTSIRHNVHTDNSFLSQPNRGQLRSTSRKRRSSTTWFSNPNQGSSNGSPGRFKPSRPNIGTFARSPFFCLPA